MGIMLRRLRYRFRSPRHKRPVGYAATRRWRRKLPILILIVFLVIGAVGGWVAARRIGALARQTAADTLNQRFTREIHTVVLAMMQEEKETMHRLTQTDRDEQGAVRSVTVDHTEANRLKADLVARLEETLCEITAVDTRIPIGILLSDTLYSGIGIRIPIRVFFTDALKVDLTESFDTAGINQTRYRIAAEVTVSAKVGGVTAQDDVCVTTCVPLAETILVGAVPSAYLPSMQP